MAWEKRRNGREYYYRARRVGDRIEKTYVGGGAKGQAAAAADRAARKSRAEARQGDWEKLLDVDQLVIGLEELARNLDLIVTCQALCAGWKKHSRQWRASKNERNRGHD